MLRNEDSTFSRTMPKFLFLFLLVFSNFHGNAQNDVYWLGLSTKNPAIIGAKTDWVYGSHFFSNLDNIFWGLGAGADLTLGPKVGYVGAFFDWERLASETVSQIQFNYSYQIQLKEIGFLNIGVALGVLDYTNDLNAYSIYDNMTHSSPNLDKEKLKSLKTGIGVFFNSERFDWGVSYNRYDELKNELGTSSNYEVSGFENRMTVMGVFRFPLAKDLVVEPNLLVDFAPGQVDKYFGAFIKYDQRIWAGYSSFNINDLHSIMAGFDIKSKFNIGYSYDFTRLFSQWGLNVHEFMLAYRLN